MRNKIIALALFVGSFFVAGVPSSTADAVLTGCTKGIELQEPEFNGYAYGRCTGIDPTRSPFTTKYKIVAKCKYFPSGNIYNFAATSWSTPSNVSISLCPYGPGWNVIGSYWQFG